MKRTDEVMDNQLVDEVLKKKILDRTIEIFNDKGLKCTMDDIAKACGISKKTIYTVFCDKEELFLGMSDYLFKGIKGAEKEVLEKKNLSTVEKLRKMMGAMPESYIGIDFTQLSGLKEKFPKVYQSVSENLESGWEATIELLEEGKKEGLIRKEASIPIIKMMMESTLEHFFQTEVLAQNGMNYKEGLDQVVDIILDGILVR